MAATTFFWRQHETVGNFGDALTLVYRAHLLGAACRYDRGSLHLVGSVITPNRIGQSQRAGRGAAAPPGPAIFWGCGKKDDVPLAAELQRACVFLGIRGTMSARVLGLPDTTPLGDTALLLPRCYTPLHDPATAGKVLWVPHFHYADPGPADLDGCPDHVVRRPGIANSVEACERFIDAIASADFVMANAMHAAVVALAYGVPFAFWKGSEINCPFKWADFASGVGFALPFSRTVAAGRRAWDAVRPDRAFAAWDPAPLLAVAPFELRDRLSG